MTLASTLAQVPLFTGLDAGALRDLAKKGSVVRYASGQRIFQQGSAPDCMYLLLSGRLNAENTNGEFLHEISRLEPIGEVGLLSGEERAATVYAARDSELFRLDRDVLLDFLTQHPSALLRMSQVVVQRLRQNQRRAVLEQTRRPRTLAIVAAHEGLQPAVVGRLLHAGIGHVSGSACLDSAEIDRVLGPGAAQTPLGDGDVERRLVDWLHDQEARRKHLILIGDAGATAWSQRCLRHADRILVLADVRDPPKVTAMVQSVLDSGVRAPVDLLLLRPTGVPMGDVAGWRKCTGATGHFFMRPGDAEDAARIGRSLTGRGLGIVLGGGGARGFAHIGLIRALEELKLPIDVIGGSSMGAFLGALAACGHSAHDIQQLTRHTFVDSNPISDWLLPRVALVRGKKMLSRLDQLFGDRLIEGLRVPYFCVSTNLTRGRSLMHDAGPLAIWVATSMSVPGIAPPVVWHDDLLVDGAVMNALPTDLMQSLGRGSIIASDVSTEGLLSVPGVEGPDPEAVFRRNADFDGTGRKPTLFSILFRTATLTSESGTRARAACADLYLRMPVGNMGMFDWKMLDALVEKGYEYAMSELEPFRDQIMSS